MLFLSYAEEDGEVAAEVAGWLTRLGQQVYRWRDPEHEELTIEGIEEQISQADDYVALFSPDFLASVLCRREREMATCREQGLQVSDPEATFFHVLQVRDTEDSADGFPPRPQWVDLTDLQNREAALHHLASRLGSGVRARSSDAGPAGAGRGSLFFRNRSDELDLVVRGLTNTAGSHFWLVIAPPQLGKTWFLDRLGAMLILEEMPAWVVRLADLRDQPAQARTDVGLLLKCLFGPDSPTTIERRTFLRIARKIISNGKPYLCLIDSAELLAEETARTLRFCLSQIHHIVDEAGYSDARLAVVVASRREDEWRGVTPDPRMSILPLTEFKLEVVQQALSDLANEMDRDFDHAPFVRNAARVHRLGEGLPALLVRCLAWIRHQEWAGMERLEEQEIFEELAQPYIKNGLLSRESLFPLSYGQLEPQNAGPPEAPSLALEHALRILAPYRLFTQSHLRHYLESDRDLARSMRDLNWSLEDLWRAISGTALLSRPLNEPWQEIPAAIRRLLYRYYYPSERERADAHREARSFVEVWADRQQGKEQVVGLVECLWHEAAVLRLDRPSGLEVDLVRSAGTLSLGLKPSPAYTEAELREYAAERIRNDEEFQDVVDDESIFNRIVASVVAPHSG